MEKKIFKSIHDQAEQMENHADCANTVQNVGYIYSSQPIFIVFKLFHKLILRETIISTCSGETLFLSLVTIRTRWQKIKCANSFLLI